jgi:hypothetical protein
MLLLWDKLDKSWGANARWNRPVLFTHEGHLKIACHHEVGLGLETASFGQMTQVRLAHDLLCQQVDGFWTKAVLKGFEAFRVLVFCRLTMEPT